MKKAILQVTILISILLFSIHISFGQNELVFKGSIIDGNDKTALPFAHLNIINDLNGTTTDENGDFEINYSEGDSISISYLGYEDVVVIPSQEISDRTISLFPLSNELPEIVVGSISAEEMVRLAIENHSDNIPYKEFNSRSYYHEMGKATQDGKDLIKGNEAVFISHYPAPLDTTKQNQHRLVLHEETIVNNPVDITFITESKKLKKMEAKVEEEKAQSPESENDVASSGPESILGLYNVIKLAFLDTLNFDRLSFNYAPSSRYQGRDINVIEFKSIKKINGFTDFEGKIYIENENYAFVSLEYVEKAKIPKILQPLIAMKIGFKIKNIKNVVTLNNQEHQGKWYPKNIIKESSLVAFKNGLFSKNIRADFYGKEILNIDKIDLEQPSQIIKSEEYNSKVLYSEQIYNHENLDWSQINRIGNVIK